MDSIEKEDRSYVSSGRGRRPKHKTLLIVASLIAVMVAVHSNENNGGGPGEIGTIPPPFMPSLVVSPPAFVSPPLISPPLLPASVTPPFVTLPSVTPPSVTPPRAMPDTILVACNGSTYRDLCISSLSSYRGAPSADMTELAGIAVQLSLNQTHRASDSMDDLSRKATEKKEKSALEDCVEVFQDTLEQLNNSLSALHHLDSKSFQEAMGDVQTWVRAALTKPSTCVEGFQEVNVNLIAVVKAQAKNVTEFMSNALAVVNKLATTQDLPSVTPQGAVSGTILVACNGSTYRDLCISSLSSYPGASTANMTELAGIAVQLSLDQSQRASDSMDKLSRKAADKKEKSALEDCVEVFQDTLEQLNNSLSALHHLESKSFQEAIGDVQTWVRAALTKPSTCVDGFQKVNANLIPVVKAQTKNVTEFMSNALAVVHKLATTQDLVNG